VRLGLFGGTFDPPHVGHLIVASDALELLDLDKVVFVPASEQPLKRGVTVAPPEARLHMVRETIGSEPRLGVNSAEIDRGGLSYTLDTVQWFAEHYPSAERFFLLGADAFRSMESWREPGRIVSLVHLALLARADEGGDNADVTMVRQQVFRFGGVEALEPHVVPTRRIDISSTEIRARVRNGKSIAGFVVDVVARYIADSGLYR
jgi:nicotinate-nucleotide adenylyltransferase